MNINNDDTNNGDDDNNGTDIMVSWRSGRVSVPLRGERPGIEKAPIVIKSLEKTNGFERRCGSGAAGDGKLRFSLKSFRKLTVLSVGKGRERPGMEKSFNLNQNILEN